MNFGRRIDLGRREAAPGGLSGAVFLCVGLLAAPALAQTPSAQEEPAAKQMHEVTVTDTDLRDSYALSQASTATKTDTPLIETPATIAVVPQQVIIDQRAMGLDQVLTNAAGVYSTGYEPSSENIYIRGFNTSQTLWNGFRLDEYSTTGHGVVGGVLMDNAEKVEILSGPASILYGRVEPGGMVNVITKQPLDHFEGSAAVTVGSWRQLWSGVDITGPVDDGKTLRYRLNASAEHADSWLWGDSTAQFALAPVIEWRPAPGTRLALEGQFEQQSGTGGTQVHLWDPNSGAPIPQPRPYSPLVNSGVIDVSRVLATVEQKLADEWSVTAKALHSLSAGPVAGDSYVAQVDFPITAPGNLAFDRNAYAGNSLNRLDAVDVDVVGHAQLLGLRHTLLIGGDFYHQFLDYPTLGYSCCYTTNFYDPSPLPGSAAIAPQGANGYYFGGTYRTASRSYGIYLQDQVKLPWDLQLLAGVRYQHSALTSSGNFVSASLNTDPTQAGTYAISTTDNPGGYTADVIPSITSVSSPSNPAIVDHTFNPRIGLLWHPADWWSVYYTYVTNYGVNNGGIGFGGVPLPPESAREHEVGFKTEFFGGKLISAAALYDLTKFHMLAGDPRYPGLNYSVTIGEVQSKGAEWTLQGEIGRDWDVLTTLSYTQPYVKVGGQYASAGHILGGVPEHQFNFWATYKVPQPGLAGLKLGLGANWVASTIQPLTTFETPPYWLVSAMASYGTRLGGHDVDLQLNVNNLLNKDYYTNIYVYAGNQVSYNYGNPTQVRLTARVSF